MSNIEKMKEILKKEYNENCTKISELSEKIRIIEKNDFETKSTIALLFSMLSWLAITFLLPTIIKTGIIPINLISPLSVVVPAFIGITGETLLTKKSNAKKEIKALSKSKSQKEIIAELTRYEIEREKLTSSNKVLEKAYDNLESKQNSFDLLSNEYNIVEKESDSKSVEELNLNIEKITEILDQKKRKIDIITTKSVLQEKFWRIRDRVQKVIDIITIFMLGGSGFMMVYDMPIIAINNLGNNIQLQTSILGILAPFGIGGLVCGGYSLKRIKNRIYAFRNVNKELGQEALSEEIKRKTYNNDIERFDIELENLINDACMIKLQLESERQKLDNASQISQTKSVYDELVHDKETFVGEELQLNEQLLESPLMQEVQGPRLVKTKTSQNGKSNN